MASGWKFFERRPNDKVRDPIQGEFFAAEGDGESFEALVREAIQNSLDAAVDGDSVPVRVRIKVGQASATQVAPFLADAWEHLHARGNGLRAAPSQIEACRYIAIEDFETSGLEGDERATSQSESKKNGFFCFFRAEGVSEKQGDDRGRWGLGKTVFPKSSRMNSMFGLTVRQSDRRRLLMGNIALKTRSVGGKEWTPDGWFGMTDQDGTVVPTTVKAEIDTFISAFSLSRGTEAGLSVVIPFVASELSTSTLADYLEREVARAYFIPILRGQLIVEVVTEQSRLVDVGRVRALCQVAGFPADEAAIVSLALASEQPSTEGNQTARCVVPECQHDRHDWAGFELEEQAANDLRAQLERGEIVAFDVPVTVFPKSQGGPRKSVFSVLLRRDESVTKSVCRFVREGITVTRERKAPTQAGMAALVEIGPGALASALGDAENPAHTQWNPKSNDGRMRDNYIHAPALLEYVRQAPHALVQAIYRHAAPDDDLLLADFFPQDLLEEGKPAHSSKGKKKPQRVGPPPAPPEPKLRHIRIDSSMKGEFEVLPGGAALALGAKIRVRVRIAYDRQTGNPLGKWNPADFMIAVASISERRGLKILRCEGNQIEFEIEQADFKLRVGGFDERRDLYISSTVLEASSDSQD
jgi:hypothetical protein